MSMLTAMRCGVRRSGLLAALIALGWGASGAEAGPVRVAIVHADITSSAADVKVRLVASGLFDVIDLFDASDPGGTPTLAQLSAYDSVLSYTNFAPDDAIGLGDVLADYVDAGGGLVLGGYGLGDVATGGGSTAFAGRIAQAGYSPLAVTANLADPDGGLSVLVASDPIFNGLDVGAADFYYHDAFFANPTLDAGATLLATDTGGLNLIARSASGRIVALNLFPGFATTDNSDAFYQLLANGLTSVVPVAAVPEPGTALLAAEAGLAALGIACVRRRRSRSRV